MAIGKTNATNRFINTSVITATANDVLSPKIFIDANGDEITGTIPSKAAATYTPSTKDQTISANTYLTGIQTIEGDSNLKAENIKSGVSIFDIDGTMMAGIGDMSAFYNFTVAKSGSFTLLDYSNEYVIQHGLGSIPKFVFIYTDNTPTSGSSYTSETIAVCAFRTCNDKTITTTTSGGVYFITQWCDISAYSGNYLTTQGFGATPVVAVDGNYNTFLSSNGEFLKEATTQTITYCHHYFKPGTYKWLMMA